MIRRIACVLAVISPAMLLSTGCRETQNSAHLERGGQAYLAQCSVCHGVKGAGDGPLAASMDSAGKPRPAVFAAERVAELGRAGVRRAIESEAHQLPGSAMPLWGSHLGSVWVDRITDFVVAMPAAGEAGGKMIDGYLAAPAGSPPSGRQVYVTYCSSCHGPQGGGDGFFSNALAGKLRPARLRGAVLSRLDDPELSKLISLGGAHAPKAETMPGWLYTITPDDRQALVGYLRTLAGTVKSD